MRRTCFIAGIGARRSGAALGRLARVSTTYACALPATVDAVVLGTHRSLAVNDKVIYFYWI